MTCHEAFDPACAECVSHDAMCGSGRPGPRCRPRLPRGAVMTAEDYQWPPITEASLRAGLAATTTADAKEWLVQALSEGDDDE